MPPKQTYRLVSENTLAGIRAACRFLDQTGDAYPVLNAALQDIDNNSQPYAPASAALVEALATRWDEAAERMPYEPGKECSGRRYAFTQCARDLRAALSQASGSTPDSSSLATTKAAAWNRLCEVDDRTSPEDYPDMLLITQEELFRAMDEAQASGSALGVTEELPAPCYLMSEPHLSGYRVILGYETMEQSMDAQTALAKHFKEASR